MVHFFSYSVAINGECQGENEEMPRLGEPIPMVKCSPKSFVFVCYCWALLHIYIYNYLISLKHTQRFVLVSYVLLISFDIIETNNHCFCSWFVVASVVQILHFLWFPFPISEVVLVINFGNAVKKKTAIIAWVVSSVSVRKEPNAAFLRVLLFDDLSPLFCRLVAICYISDVKHTSHVIHHSLHSNRRVICSTAQSLLLKPKVSVS